MRRLRLLALLALTLLVLLPAAGASLAAGSPSSRHDAFPLHAGSSGPRVAALQWLLAGHRPNVFTQVKPTFHGKPNGWYGARTKSSTEAMKFRIGYPAEGQCGAKRSQLTETAGRYLFALLQGKRQRPRCWVAVAAERVKGAVTAGHTKAALRIQKLELAQLGVHEIPDRSNLGPCISFACSLDGHLFGPYQGSTGAYGAAWCASFADWALKQILGHGFGSANDAYVPTIAEWAQQHNWLAAKPRFGAFVIFLSSDLQLVNAFHIGYVVRVTASGVQTIEGNAGGDAHHGGEVLEQWRPYAINHMLYIDYPEVA